MRLADVAMFGFVPNACAVHAIHGSEIAQRLYRH